jgi:hypothetical protein
MSSELAIIDDAAEIMRSLPSQLHNDSFMQDCVIEGLQHGLSNHEVRLIALEAVPARLKKLEETVAHGFNLVNNEIQGIKHEAEKDRIHANYAKQAAEKAQAIAEQAWLKTQEVAIGVAKAEAKADGARDLVKSRSMNIDPYWGMGLTAIAIFVTLAMFTRVEKVEEYKPQPRTQSQQSAPIYSCDRSAINVSGTTDFSKCKKLSGEV